MRVRTMMALAALAALTLAPVPAASAATLADQIKGLTVAAEQGGYPGQDALNVNYDRDGLLSRNKSAFDHCDGYYSRYDATCHPGEDAVNGDHRVSIAEAWRSGLRGDDAWERFDGDAANLNVMSADLNQHVKSDADAAEWLPANARCHYLSAYVATKVKYGLSVDKSEKTALLEAAAQCSGGGDSGKDNGGDTGDGNQDGGGGNGAGQDGGNGDNQGDTPEAPEPDPVDGDLAVTG